VSDLRITETETSAQAVTLKLEGKVAGEGAELLARECRGYAKAGLQITLNFRGVTYVDAPGSRVLKSLIRNGARVDNCSDLIEMLIQEGESR